MKDLKIEMKNKKFTFAAGLLAVLLMLTSAGSPAVVAVTAAPAGVASSEAEARGTVERAFQQLKGGDYDSLYEVLPSASQRRVTRERFVGALKRTRGMYELDRLEIGAVRVVGDVGMADSVVYGRVRAPFEGEAKIVARQYLVREGGRWRVTTGDAATIRPLLAANPAFAKKYPFTQPRVYLKQNGKWVDFSGVLRSGVRRRANK
ncbi:MAG: hypothetical protein QOD32_1368 [Pyrinomonadaceae bacterium]|jgi:hypothetical protein|nr:hypothetical protein [Pyrinomonadaceae bacterium]